MNEVSYENIDLFYYHSIDIDFARLFSILQIGIVSQQAALEEHVKYYYRNYTHASCKKDFISVSHFPQTIFRYYRIQNELYDFNANKITFILDDIYVLDKQSHRNRYKYTNERHVQYKIEPSSIRGILMRECDAQKLISDIAFNTKYTDPSFLEHKVFSTIHFFQDYFGSFGNVSQIYYLIGKLREAQISNMPTDDIIKSIAEEMRKNIQLVLSTTLGIPNPTLLDIVQYINKGQYPIYIMNMYDIQEPGKELKQTDPRVEQFKETSNCTITEMKKQEAIDKKILKLLSKVSNYGCDIYYDYTAGPYTQEDSVIIEEIKKLTKK